MSLFKVWRKGPVLLNRSIFYAGSVELNDREHKLGLVSLETPFFKELWHSDCSIGCVVFQPIMIEIHNPRHDDVFDEQGFDFEAFKRLVHLSNDVSCHKNDTPKYRVHGYNFYSVRNNENKGEYCYPIRMWSKYVDFGSVSR